MPTAKAKSKPSADPRLLAERAHPRDGRARLSKGPQPRTVTVNLSESPLGWLFARGHLDARQFEAGEKLRSDYERAQLGVRTTMRWDGMPGAGGRRGTPGMLEASERQIAAKQRFDGALAHIGRDLNDIAWRVICAGESVPVAEKDLGWPARSGKLVLRLALDRLADYYRLPG